MAEATDNDTIMKAACIQAAATVMAQESRHDPLAVVTTAEQILKKMEELGYYSLEE